jgi:ATP-dependent DNA helicase RecG
MHPAQRRLAFEELLAHHLALRGRRAQRDTLSATPIPPSVRLWPTLRGQLDFDLTGAQQRVIDEILADIAKAHPALRLIQGDVGSGKTIVAAAAVLAAVEAGLQAVVMAPTELLAEQHLAVFGSWLSRLALEPVWLSGRLSQRDRREACTRLANGQARVAIGTHALFQDDVSYDQLGLVVVDEQHRFGVAQRLALRDKGRIDDHAPHQLIMSATPIPRSLTMVMHADMDISVIDEMPPGRQPVETVALPNSRRLEVQARIREACARGHRAYWVCPLVEDSEVLAVQAATSRAETLRAELPGLVIALLHGRTPAAEKEAAMNDFRCGRTDVLVATTIIEVGVDVPEASVMVIENAERLGLSQLHQLRGRVGRGDRQSTCVLMYQPPLGSLARERLAALRQTTDGFAIAQKDLELRGPGELLGTRQSGVPQFRVADLARDRALLPAVQTTATRLLRDNPGQAPGLIARWLGCGLEFSDA